MDPVGNIACPNTDFLTLHICEDHTSYSTHCAAYLAHSYVIPKDTAFQAGMRMCTFADPDNWAIDSWEFDWVNANAICDHAQNIAHAANKPFIIEETGMKVPPNLLEAPQCADIMQG